MSDDDVSVPPSGDPRTPSKSRRKREMQHRQDLGESLAALSAGQLAALGLPERLADAITAVRTITRHEARRRQMQYIGRLMREVDPEPIAEALARLDEAPRAEKARFAALEAWRDRLLRDDAALTEFVAAHPQADIRALRALVADVRVERANGSPPHKYRLLFRTLNAHVAPRAGDAPAQADDLPSGDDA